MMYVKFLIAKTIYRWIKRYEELEKIKRLNKKPTSYKITMLYKRKK